jgi:hypothetical protein
MILLKQMFILELSNVFFTSYNKQLISVALRSCSHHNKIPKSQYCGMVPKDRTIDTGCRDDKLENTIVNKQKTHTKD